MTPDQLTDDQKRDLQAGRVWLPNGTSLGAIVQACDVAGIDQDRVRIESKSKMISSTVSRYGILLTVERDG